MEVITRGGQTAAAAAEADMAAAAAAAGPTAAAAATTRQAESSADCHVPGRILMTQTATDVQCCKLQATDLPDNEQQQLQCHCNSIGEMLVMLHQRPVHQQQSCALIQLAIGTAAVSKSPAPPAPAATALAMIALQ